MIRVALVSALCLLASADAAQIMISGPRCFGIDCASEAGGDTLVHGEEFTVTGTFPAQPESVLHSDTMDHGNTIAAMYPFDGYGPRLNDDPDSDMDYRSVPFARPTGTSAPTINVPEVGMTRIAAGGATGDDSEGNLSYNTRLFRYFTQPAGVHFIRVGWWEYVDDEWNQSLGDPQDNNYKFFDYSAENGPMSSEGNWYFNYAPPVDFASPLNAINDEGDNLTFSGLTFTQDGGADPRQWLFREVLMEVRDDANGQTQLYESNDLVWTHTGENRASYPSSTHILVVGGYNRAYYGGNQWRYFGRNYMDVTANDFAIYLTNNNSWDSSTIRVWQPRTSNDGSTWTGTCVAGQLSTGTVYVHARRMPWVGGQSDTALETRSLN